MSPHLLMMWLQQFSSEGLTLVLFLCCGFLILFMMRVFGATGLMVYSSLAVVVANIQVQKASTFDFFHEPIALGTVVFSSIFYVSSILTEYYGKAEAKKAVWLSFSGMLLITLFMFLTMGFKPAVGYQESHNAMCVLFLPAPALLISSLIAYVIGQQNDIWLFSLLSKLTDGKALWLRTFVSTLIAAFLDNLVFSVLAWMVFSSHPLPWKTVFFTYILGTYIIRLFMAFMGIPFLYLARFMTR
ncbi:MAG: queuosine precursor transporter [Alphaproteobacteria bacterium]|nr:queuosine precursor transporter [Alphaproteobacteria bacterium]